MAIARSRWLFAALAVASAGAGCTALEKAPSTRSGEGTSTSGQALATMIAQNGLTTNGLIGNGLIGNGLIGNGLIGNGLIGNGLIGNGLIGNGLIGNGLIGNGLYKNGAWENGLIGNGLIGNGLIGNGLIGNGLIGNGLIGNGAPGTVGYMLVNNAYAREFLQYVYSCAMPAGVTETLDPGIAKRACSSSLPCDAGYTCSASNNNTCVVPCSSGQCDVGYTCSANNTCVVALSGAIGLGINADGTHWWDAPAASDAGAGDAGTTSNAGSCDESCQRWVSACVLARTNAFGVHLVISMRAPASAPVAIQNALALASGETTTWAKREGSYYGNIFATTPVKPPPSSTYSGPTTGPIRETPSFNACAGPASNIPEITDRFCSSQGDQVVINVSGVCLEPPTDSGVIPPGGVCNGIDDPNTGAVFECYTSADKQQSASAAKLACSNDPNCFSQVITAYLDVPLFVCGNAVCERATNPAGEEIGEDVATLEGGKTNPGYCPGDCHPATWTNDIAPNLEGNLTDLANTNLALSPANPGLLPSSFFQDGIPPAGGAPSYLQNGMLALEPDNTIVVAGYTPNDVYVGGVFLPRYLNNEGQLIDQGVGILAKYNPDGSPVWAVRFGTANGFSPFTRPSWSDGALQQVNGISVGVDGGITVVGLATTPVELQTKSEIWTLLFSALDGSQEQINGGGGGVSIFGAPGSSITLLPGAFAGDAQGSLIVAGVYSGQASIGGIGLPISESSVGDLFVANLLPPSGSASWARGLGCCGATSLVLDPSSNIVVTGGGILRKLCSDGTNGRCSDGSTAFPPNQCPNGSNGVCPDGSQSWTKNAQPGSYQIATAKSGDVYATGYLNGNGVFNTDGTVNVGVGPYGFPPFIVKYDTNGNPKWANFATVACPPSQTNCAPLPTTGASIGFDAAGDVVVGSYGAPAVGGSIDFGIGPFPTYASTNTFLAAYSPNSGVTSWAKKIPTILGGYPLGMAIDGLGHVVMAGVYGGSMQFDDRLLETILPQQPSTVDSFVASFKVPELLGCFVAVCPPPPPPPTTGVGHDLFGNKINTVPSNIVVQATSAAGAQVFFMPPTAIDNTGAGTSVVCSPAPNTTFPMGQTTVTCTASDPFGRQSSPVKFTVTVIDTIGPVLSAVDDMTVPATSPSGAIVTYTAPTAVDQVDGIRPVTCTPPSGSTFAVGKTTVTCTASDLSNNESAMTFSVNVTGHVVASSIASNFNGTAIASGSTIWFSAVMKVQGLGAQKAHLYLAGSSIVFTANGVPHNFPVPDAVVTIDPAATQATTMYNTSLGRWETTLPTQWSGNALLSAVETPVTANLPGGINPVTWSGSFSADTPGLTVNWAWSAAAYKTFSASYGALGVKPVDDTRVSVYQNSDHAGTPESYKANVIGGARGGGGSNYTGSLSGTASVSP